MNFECIEICQIFKTENKQLPRFREVQKPQKSFNLFKFVIQIENS